MARLPSRQLATNWSISPETESNWDIPTHSTHPTLDSVLLLRTVTMPIKNFLSHAKTSLSSFLSSHSPCSQCRMSLNCQDTTMHIVKLQPPVSLSGCMMINCPLCCTAQSCIQSHDGPCDCPTVRTDSISIQNPCPDLDPLSSTDSLQTHDSLVTPESPYLPSPAESLEEGTTEGDTQVQAPDPATADVTHVTEVTPVRTHDTQVRTNDSLAYDSLVTTLSRLSLEPQPEPLSDPHQIISDPYRISITTPHPLRPDLDPIGSSDNHDSP